MKKLFISLVSLGVLFIPFQETQASWISDAANKLWDSAKKGAGIGVDTNNDGKSDIQESAENWANGVGKDITTDLFGNTGVGPIPDGQFTLPCPEVFNGIAQTTSIRQYVLNIVKWVLGFLGLLAVIMIIYGGLLYVTDGGEGSNVEKAKKILLYSVIGILIVFAAYPLVNSLIGIASTGDEPVAGQPLYVASNQNSSLSLSEACELQQNANLRPWFGWDWTNSLNVNEIRSNIIQVPLGTSVTLKIKESDLGAGTYTPEIKFVHWNLGDGNGWMRSSSEDELSFPYNFNEAGKYYAAVVITDENNTQHKLLTQIIVGDVLEAKFSASDYFPISGQEVQFDGRISIVNFGGIAEYEWTVSGDEGCPEELFPGNSPIVSAVFYGDNLICDIDLTIYSDVIDKSTEEPFEHTASLEGNNEIIEVSLTEGDKLPTPEMNEIIVKVNPNDIEEEDHLVSVKVKAWDPIAQPLQNYRFEVFESGELITSKVVNFGQDIGESEGGHESFSETVFDFSPYKGIHEYLFRVTVTNDFGRTASMDSELEEVVISNGNTAPTAVVYVDPEIGYTDTEFDFRAQIDDVDQDDPLTYKWIYPNGISTDIQTVPNTGEVELLDRSFSTSGNKIIKLLVSDGVDEREFTKSVFVGNGVVNVAPEIISVFPLPSSVGPIGGLFSFYPQVVDVNGDALTYVWNFNNEGTVETKNAAFQFSTIGEKEVTLTVSDEEEETVKVINLQVYDPNDPESVEAVGNSNTDTFPEIKYIIKEPGVVARVGEEFVFTPSVIDDGEALNYQWDFGNGDISEQEIGTNTYENAGNYVVRLEVSDESNNVAQTAFSLQVIGENAIMPNRAPVIKGVTVLPKSYGKLNEPFTFLADGYDPDENDSVEYIWKTDTGEIATGNQVSLSFEKEGYNVVVLTASDGSLDTVFTKTVYISNSGESSPSSQVLVANKTPQINRIINTPGQYVRLGEESIFSADITDENLETISYEWNLGDGTVSTNNSVNHVYSAPGQYLVTVQVFDEIGAIATKKISLRVFGPDEEMPNRPAVIKEVQVLPAQYGTLETEFTFKSLIEDADGDDLTIEWKTIDGVFSTELIADKTFVETGYKTVYLQVSDGKSETSQLVNVYVSNEGVPFEEVPDGWQSQYLELLALIASLESQEQDLIEQRDDILEQIINEEDETVREELKKQLQLIESQIENVQDNKSLAQLQLEAVKSNNTEGQSLGVLDNNIEREAEINKQIEIIENLINEGEVNTLDALKNLTIIEKKYLDLWSQFLVTDDPVERSKLKELLQTELKSLYQAKEKHITLVSEQEALKKELNFLQESLGIQIGISRVEKQREIQKLRRIIKQLSVRQNSIEEELQSLELSKSDLLEQISIESEKTEREIQQEVFETQHEKENALYDELLSTKKSIAGMESEIVQKEAELYVSSIQTKEAITAKIKKITQDIVRIEDSLSLFSENLLALQLERTVLEQNLVAAETIFERNAVEQSLLALTEKITNTKKGIATQERKIEYFKRAIDRLQTQILNLVGSGYEVGIKNKEELQQKLENTEAQIQVSKETLIGLKSSRESQEETRNLFLTELESDISEVEKSIILEKIKALDIALFELDKKIVEKESAFEVLNRAQISFKKDLFGSVSAADLRGSMAELEAQKKEVELFQDQFIEKLQDKRVKRKALLEQLKGSVEPEVFQILTRELENLEIYETNVEQFGLVFELGTAIQHQSFPNDSIDFSREEELVRLDRNSAMARLIETISEEDQSIFLPLYNQLSVEIYNLEKRVLEQSDTIDLIELKKELLLSAMEDEKVVFEEKINEKVKKIATLKDSIESLFSERFELEKDWKSAREKLVLESNPNKSVITDLENIDAQIIKTDLEIAEIKAELFSLIVQIDAYYELLDKYFIIKGTVNTKFFLYGRLPNDTAQALFIEWHTGDGRTVYGQNAIISYDVPGRYVVKMNVTDGVNTSTDSIIIKVENK